MVTTLARRAPHIEVLVFPTPVQGDEAPADLGRYGEVSVVGPVAELKVDRAHVGEVLAAILDRHTLADMSVQDPPLDQVIAWVFEEGRARHEEQVAAAAK